MTYASPVLPLYHYRIEISIIFTNDSSIKDLKSFFNFINYIGKHICHIININILRMHTYKYKGYGTSDSRLYYLNKYNSHIIDSYNNFIF